jgi:hypothetical protein
VCDVGYQGLNCSVCSEGYHRIGLATCTVDRACEPDSCSGHGTCAVVRGGPVCSCASGYDGPTCASCYGGFIDVSDAGFLDAGVDAGLVRAGPSVCVLPAQCTPGSCGPGFTCDDSTGAISCRCDGVCPACTATTCSGHGACDDSSGATTCTCEPGYTGNDCSRCTTGSRALDGGTCIPADQCTLTTCSGAGLCSLTAGVASCACSTGSDGASCERCAMGFHRNGSGRCEADQTCAPTSCPRNATCAAVQGVITCPCRPGYAGSGCTQCYPGYHAVDAGPPPPDGGFGTDSCVLDDLCTATSCGRGTCEDATGTVVCSNCPTGFTGARCEVNIDDCGTACQQGQCIDLVASRLCLCTDNTYGQTCLPGPALTQVAPNVGSRLGGTSIVLTGSGFVSGVTVTIGGASAAITGQTATSLTVTTPPSTTLGPKDVIVRAPNGQLARGTFTYAPQAFTYTGALQSFTVPPGVTSLTVNVWGAAGGAGNGTGVVGGAGGYSAATVPVDAGQVLTLLVGQGGARLATSPDGGVSSGAGSGGGLSGLFFAIADGGISQATALVIAGGGGGGGFFSNVAFGSSGGNGGGDFGGEGAVMGTTSFAGRGLGGSRQAGGIGGCSTGPSMAQCGQNGQALQGGGGGTSAITTPRLGATFGGGGGVGRSALFNSGGGGGGYFGGGGGANETAQGGGGGSAFFAPFVINGASSRGATPGQPEGQSVIGYVPRVGVGGGVGMSTSGGNGLILIAY